MNCRQWNAAAESTRKKFPARARLSPTQRQNASLLPISFVKWPKDGQWNLIVYSKKNGGAPEEQYEYSVVSIVLRRHIVYSGIATKHVALQLERDVLFNLI